MLVIDNVCQQWVQLKQHWTRFHKQAGLTQTFWNKNSSWLCLQVNHIQPQHIHCQQWIIMLVYTMPWFVHMFYIITMLWIASPSNSWSGCGNWNGMLHLGFLPSRIWLPPCPVGLKQSKLLNTQENRQQLLCLCLKQFGLHLLIHQIMALTSGSYD